MCCILLRSSCFHVRVFQSFLAFFFCTALGCGSLLKQFNIINKLSWQRRTCWNGSLGWGLQAFRWNWIEFRVVYFRSAIKAVRFSLLNLLSLTDSAELRILISSRVDCWHLNVENSFRPLRLFCLLCIHSSSINILNLSFFFPVSFFLFHIDLLIQYPNCPFLYCFFFFSFPFKGGFLSIIPEPSLSHYILISIFTPFLIAYTSVFVLYESTYNLSHSLTFLYSVPFVQLVIFYSPDCGRSEISSKMEGKIWVKCGFLGKTLTGSFNNPNDIMLFSNSGILSSYLLILHLMCVELKSGEDF